MKRLPAALLALVIAMTGCSRQSPDSPGKSTTGEAAVAEQLATALSRQDVSSVPMSPEVTALAAEAERKLVWGGMDGAVPTVKVDKVDGSGAERTVTLKGTTKLASGEWSWQSKATLVQSNDKSQWLVRWAPSVVEEHLDGRTRLSHIRTLPKRASIMAANSRALVEVRPAYRVGVDKGAIDKAQWAATAKALAAVVKVDPATYAAQVEAAGEKQFVPAITMREGQVPAAAQSMKGVTVLPIELPLAPSKTFAAGLLGTSGEVDASEVKTSNGALTTGDIVGKSGLQKWYDEQLRGIPGEAVRVVVRKKENWTKSSPNASSPSAESSGQPDSDATPGELVTELFSTEPKPGKNVVTSLDVDKQTLAEKVLSTQKGNASLVVIDVATGGVVAAANSPAAGANSFATSSALAPGSTFKVVTSLALLRKGLTPASKVPCTPTVTINGRTFKNYDDFPSIATGQVPLATAVAQSCNTAFISQWQKVTPQDLADAAGSLGLGVDYKSGFGANFGSVPLSTDDVTRGANMIGQGQVTASPVAMAAVAASVASGHTVVPWLVDSVKATPTAKPLTAAEAAMLQELMKGVVANGSGRSVASVATGAKTGTAEWGTTNPPKAHAWMIAFNGKYAIAAMVEDGISGSKSAAPLVKAFLEGK